MATVVYIVARKIQSGITAWRERNWVL